MHVHHLGPDVWRAQVYTNRQKREGVPVLRDLDSLLEAMKIVEICNLWKVVESMVSAEEGPSPRGIDPDVYVDHSYESQAPAEASSRARYPMSW